MTAALLAGCDPGGPGPVDTSAASTSPVTSTTPSEQTPSPQPTDGAQLLSDALDALYRDTSSFHVAGTIAEYDLVVDLRFGEDSTATGTVGRGNVAGAEIEVRRVADGTLYGKGTAQFYANVTPRSGPDLSGLAGRWVVIDDGAPAPLVFLPSFADRSTTLFAAGLAPDPAATYEIDAPPPGSDRSTYVVSGGGDSCVVAATGPPRPSECSNGRGAGTVRFDEFEVPLSVSAPAAGEIVAIPTA